jgi:2-dehydro-3-deoxyphosphogalactonate aldolase
MTLDELLQAGAPPVIGILRGIKPDEVAAIAGAVFAAGIRAVEVPLNSPDALRSIEVLQSRFGGTALIGAGTVLSVQAVDAVIAAGGRLIVTPNTEPAVIRRGVEAGLDVLPGFFTASEAFKALDAGALRLKLFPASSAPATHLKAVREVLPPQVEIWAVGGTRAENLAAWLADGARGLGIGGALYRPGDAPAAVGARAAAIVAAWTAATA